MSLKIDTKNFYTLLILINFLFHNKIKLTSRKNSISSKLKIFSKKINISLKELERLYNFLVKNKYVYIEESYIKVNWVSIDNLIKHSVENITQHDIFIIEDNLEIIVKPEIDLDTFEFLIKFAEFTTRDVIYKFKITQNSLHNAYNISITKDEILNFLKNFSVNKKISDTIKFLVTDIYKRTGEIDISVSSGIISANKFVIKEIKNIPELQKFILKFIGDNIILLNRTANLNEIFYLLKEKSFYPKISITNISYADDKFLLSLNAEEAKYFLTAFETLRFIGNEHGIKINFNMLDEIIKKIEEQMNSEIVKKSNHLAQEYKKSLDASIKSYILKTLKHSVKKPYILITNKLSEKYKGKNPASTKKDMRDMINYAINNNLLLFLEYVKSNLALKSEEYTVIPEYLYNDVLICKVKETRKEIKLNLKNISYIILL